MFENKFLSMKNISTKNYLLFFYLKFSSLKTQTETFFAFLYYHRHNNLYSVLNHIAFLSVFHFNHDDFYQFHFNHRGRNFPLLFSWLEKSLTVIKSNFLKICLLHV